MGLNPNLNQQFERVEGEHRDIERLLGRLDDAVAKHVARVVGIQVLGSIVESVVKHIENEERLMIVTKYARLPEHAADHNQILDFIGVALSECVRFAEADWDVFARRFGDVYRRHLRDFDDPFFATLKAG
jgi:hemerythrin